MSPGNFGSVVPRDVTQPPRVNRLVSSEPAIQYRRLNCRAELTRVDVNRKRLTRVGYIVDVLLFLGGKCAPFFLRVRTESIFEEVEGTGRLFGTSKAGDK